MKKERTQSNTSRRGRPNRRAIFLQFEAGIERLKSYGGLPGTDEAKTIWENIRFIEAHNSTALEGNTLVLREVKTLLDQNRTVGGKELREYLEVEGYGNTALWVYSQAQRTDIERKNKDAITITEIRGIHEQLMSLVWAVSPHENALPGETAGGYRKHDILPFSGGMTPPSFTDIPMLMSSFVEDANKICKRIKTGKIDTIDIPMNFAELHSRFEQIHPFLDGNGRAGRLMLNLMLVRLGYPPAIILKQRRNAYLSALGKADRGDLLPLAEILARGVIDNINRFITPAVAGPGKLVPLKTLETREHSYAMLRQAATRGRLEASIGPDGMWYSSKNALSKYLESKYKRK